MATMQEKINSLSYLTTPLTVKELRTEINKLTDIFKVSPRIAVKEDFENLVAEFLTELNRFETTSLDYGVSSSVYIVEDIMDYGNAETINV